MSVLTYSQISTQTPKKSQQICVNKVCYGCLSLHLPSMSFQVWMLSLTTKDYLYCIPWWDRMYVIYQSSKLVWIISYCMHRERATIPIFQSFIMAHSRAQTIGSIGVFQSRIYPQKHDLPKIGSYPVMRTNEVFFSSCNDLLHLACV